MLAREHLEPPHTGILPRQQLRDPEQLPAVLAACAFCSGSLVESRQRE
jgi:hypothetical protein